MTVFRPKGRTTFRYDFWWKGDRYTGNTDQVTQRDAELVEADIRKQLRLQAGGLAPAPSIESPRFEEWAEIYLEDVRERRDHIKAPERIEGLLRVVLRFFGRRTADRKDAAGPFHDLKLQDLIDEPKWLLDFEDWMRAQRTGQTSEKRPLSGQTKNQYRSVVSQMYELAMQPAFVKRTGVTRNPMVGVPRDRGMERTMTVTVDELRAWLAHASYHVRLALAIAALAPKLRLANVLKLRWSQIDRDYRYITVADHKTDKHTRRPLVIPIREQLRAILEDAWQRKRSKTFVVTYKGKPVKSIRDGIAGAAEAAGLEYGRFGETSVTFHTIRHTMATMLAELSELDGQAPLDAAVRQRAMGHLRAETTDRYTHIRPLIEGRALDRLSSVTPIVDVVTLPWTRASRPVGKKVGTRSKSRSKTLRKSAKTQNDRRTRKRPA